MSSEKKKKKESSELMEGDTSEWTQKKPFLSLRPTRRWGSIVESSRS